MIEYKEIKPAFGEPINIKIPIQIVKDKDNSLIDDNCINEINSFARQVDESILKGD